MSTLLKWSDLFDSLLFVVVSGGHLQIITSLRLRATVVFQNTTYGTLTNYVLFTDSPAVSHGC